MPATTATVNAANVYRNIITNFSDPLEFVREAISNSIDAAATKMRVFIEQVPGPTGQSEIRIAIKDDGNGMDEAKLARFFNLGDSEKSALKSDSDEEGEQLIGEKPTQFFLSREDAPNNIEVFVLKRLVTERLRISLT